MSVPSKNGRLQPRGMSVIAATALVAACLLFSCATAIRDLIAPSPSGEMDWAPLTPPCGDVVQLLGANGLPNSHIALPVRLSSTGAAVNSTSAVQLSGGSWPMLWRLSLDGYPNWFLNVTDLANATVQLNFFTEPEWQALYNGSRASCHEPQSAWLPRVFGDLNPGMDVGKSIYTLRYNLVALKPCQPFTVYLAARITATVPGFQQPQTLWAAADWVQANDPTNPTCPHSPTNWGYTKVTALYCPCYLPPPPSAPTPPSPPRPRPPACSDSQLLLSRNGVYTDTIVTTARNGWTMQPVAPSLLTMNVTWNLSRSAAVHSGQPVWAVNWTGINTPKESAMTFIAVVNETVFSQLYVRKHAACVPPYYLNNTNVIAMVNGSMGVGALSFVYGNLSAMLKPCRPLTLYMMASLEDLVGLGPPVWAGADWVQASDPTNTICPNSTTNWAYTKFEITHCPCRHPPRRLPPSPPPPQPSAVVSTPGGSAAGPQ
jgi:hypothetical protein